MTPLQRHEAAVLFVFNWAVYFAEGIDTYKRGRHRD